MRTELTRLREMTIRYRASRSLEGAPVMIDRIIRSAADAAPALLVLLEHEPSEVFVILCLSTKCRVIAYHEVSRGTLDATPVHPREVFKAALLSNAACLVLAHNHPAGDPTPSAADVDMTRQVVAAAQALRIAVHDHVVVGGRETASFRALGLI